MTMAARERDHFLATRDRFVQLLQSEAGRRSERTELIDTRTGPQLAWMVAEREAMWRLTDELRQHHGYDSVSLAPIIRVEQLACGHVDYVSKFALYCAELAHGFRGVDGRHQHRHLDV